MIPMLGWLSGRLGPRLLYILCLGTFCLGGLGSSLAWDWGSLLLFRVLAGMAGGLIQPLTMAIFYQIFPPNQRGMALAFSLIGWAVGPSIGAFIAGYVLEFAAWRTAYAIVVPLSGAGCLAAWFLLPQLQQPDRRRLDQYGLMTMAVAVITLMLALSQGNREGWDSQYILTLFAIAAVATLVFIIIELRSDEPLVELRLFCQPPFVMAAIVLFLTTVAFPRHRADDAGADAAHARLYPADGGLDAIALEPHLRRRRAASGTPFRSHLAAVPRHRRTAGVRLGVLELLRGE